MNTTYVLSIPVGDDDVKVIKEELKEYMTNHQTVSLFVTSDSEEAPSPELQNAIRNIFAYMIMTIANHGFERIQ